jgi:tRNA (guanine-N7-)-methyltransferase
VAKKKLIRFQQNAQAPNVIEQGKELYTSIKGRWNEVYFKNNFPITLELACGQGELTIAFAKNLSHRNFIGVDIKGARMWKGSQDALAAGLTNVAFLRTSIRYMAEFFTENEVDEIYLVFPDPQPKQAQYRLTNERFLRLYQKFLKPSGLLHLKTDNAPLYYYTLETVHKLGGEIIFQTTSFYESEMKDAHFGAKTFYENHFTQKGEVVHYIQFKLN